MFLTRLDYQVRVLPQTRGGGDDEPDGAPGGPGDHRDRLLGGGGLHTGRTSLSKRDTREYINVYDVDCIILS